MVFFLAHQGLRLAEFPSESAVPDFTPAKQPVKTQLPSISPLGFEIDVDVARRKNNTDFDPSMNRFRIAVFESFTKVVLYVQDTKIAIQAMLHINTDNSLLVLVPSINSICSKMHIEDISPIDSKECNHHDVGCKYNHFKDTSTLIDSADYLKCPKDEAIFCVREGSLYFRKGKKWTGMDVQPGLPDDYYTLNADNF